MSFWKRLTSLLPSRSERELLAMCHGDRERVERLIRHEQSRAPSLSRRAAARAAVRRLRSDLR